MKNLWNRLIYQYPSQYSGIDIPRDNCNAIAVGNVILINQPNDRGEFRLEEVKDSYENINIESSIYKELSYPFLCLM